MKFDMDMNKPFTAEELSKLVIAPVEVQRRNCLAAYEFPQMREGLVLGIAPSPKALNIVCAAPLLYQQLGHIMAAMTQLRTAVEIVDAKLSEMSDGDTKLMFGPTLVLLDNVENLCLQGRRVAEVGAQQVSNEVFAQIAVDRRNKPR